MCMFVFTNSPPPRSMDSCCLCDFPFRSRSTNDICSRCLHAAQEILRLSQLLDSEERNGVPPDWKPHSPTPPPAPRRSHSKGSLADAIQSIKQLERGLGVAAKRIEYLGAFGEALMEGFHTDLELVTDDGCSFRVHKVIMATRSTMFKKMLEMDGTDELRIHVRDITHTELKYLLEFMYTGQLALEALEGHSCGLLLAAYKYDIPLLVEICEIYLINTLSVEKVLDALQITSLVNCANALKEAAMNMIVQNSDSVLFSREYEEFALNNPLLAVRISQSIMQQRQHC